MPDTTNREFIDAVAEEMSMGIHRAVQFWMEQVEDVLNDSRLTTLGRLQAVRALVNGYRQDLVHVSEPRYGKPA